ncbi:hypothetical protein QOT17_001958 [Balamuthia mandrillaris]
MLEPLMNGTPTFLRKSSATSSSSHATAREDSASSSVQTALPTTWDPASSASSLFLSSSSSFVSPSTPAYSPNQRHVSMPPVDSPDNSNGKEEGHHHLLHFSGSYTLARLTRHSYNKAARHERDAGSDVTTTINPLHQQLLARQQRRNRRAHATSSLLSISDPGLPLPSFSPSKGFGAYSSPGSGAEGGSGGGGGVGAGSSKKDAAAKKRSSGPASITAALVSFTSPKVKRKRDKPRRSEEEEEEEEREDTLAGANEQRRHSSRQNEALDGEVSEVAQTLAESCLDDDEEAVQTVRVPEALFPLFEETEEVVDQCFGHMSQSRSSFGTIEVFNERHLLMRSISLSVDFFYAINMNFAELATKKFHGPKLAHKLLFDFSHAIGKADCSNLRNKLLEDMSSLKLFCMGLSYVAYIGWAFVDLTPMYERSNLVDSEDFVLYFDCSYSFEATAWRYKVKRPPKHPVCAMICGYLSGWAAESFGRELVAAELWCRAREDKTCKFVLTSPNKIKECVKAFGLTRKQKESLMMPSIRFMTQTIDKKGGLRLDALKTLFRLSAVEKPEEKKNKAPSLSAVGSSSGSSGDKFHTKVKHKKNSETSPASLPSTSAAFASTIGERHEGVIPGYDQLGYIQSHSSLLVNKIFQQGKVCNPTKGYVRVRRERYVFLRGHTFSTNFLSFIQSTYPSHCDFREEATNFAINFLWDLGRSIGNSDHRHFSRKTGLRTKGMEAQILSLPSIMANLGWGRVVIEKQSAVFKPKSPNDFFFRFTIYHSIEACCHKEHNSNINTDNKSNAQNSSSSKDCTCAFVPQGSTKQQPQSQEDAVKPKRRGSTPDPRRPQVQHTSTSTQTSNSATSSTSSFPSFSASSSQSSVPTRAKHSSPDRVQRSKSDSESLPGEDRSSSEEDRALDNRRDKVSRESSLRVCPKCGGRLPTATANSCSETHSPVCVMAAGYVSGFIQECINSELKETENMIAVVEAKCAALEDYYQRQMAAMVSSGEIGGGSGGGRSGKHNNRASSSRHHHSGSRRGGNSGRHQQSNNSNQQRNKRSTHQHNDSMDKQRQHRQHSFVSGTSPKDNIDDVSLNLDFEHLLDSESWDAEVEFGGPQDRSWDGMDLASPPYGSVGVVAAMGKEKEKEKEKDREKKASHVSRAHHQQSKGHDRKKNDKKHSEKQHVTKKQQDNNTNKKKNSAIELAEMAFMEEVEDMASRGEKDDVDTDLLLFKGAGIDAEPLSEDYFPSWSTAVSSHHHFPNHHQHPHHFFAEEDDLSITTTTTSSSTSTTSSRSATMSSSSSRTTSDDDDDDDDTTATTTASFDDDDESSDDAEERFRNENDSGCGVEEEDARFQHTEGSVDTEDEAEIDSVEAHVRGEPKTTTKTSTKPLKKSGGTTGHQRRKQKNKKKKQPNILHHKPAHPYDYDTMSTNNLWKRRQEDGGYYGDEDDSESTYSYYGEGPSEATSSTATFGDECSGDKACTFIVAPFAVLKEHALAFLEEKFGEEVAPFILNDIRLLPLLHHRHQKERVSQQLETILSFSI